MQEENFVFDLKPDSLRHKWYKFIFFQKKFLETSNLMYTLMTYKIIQIFFVLMDDIFPSHFPDWNYAIIKGIQINLLYFINDPRICSLIFLAYILPFILATVLVLFFASEKVIKGFSWVFSFFYLSLRYFVITGVLILFARTISLIIEDHELFFSNFSILGIALPAIVLLLYYALYFFISSFLFCLPFSHAGNCLEADFVECWIEEASRLFLFTVTFLIPVSSKMTIALTHGGFLLFFAVIHYQIAMILLLFNTFYKLLFLIKRLIVMTIIVLKILIATEIMSEDVAIIGMIASSTFVLLLFICLMLKKLTIKLLINDIMNEELPPVKSLLLYLRCIKRGNDLDGKMLKTHANKILFFNLEEQTSQFRNWEELKFVHLKYLIEVVKKVYAKTRLQDLSFIKYDLERMANPKSLNVYLTLLILQEKLKGSFIGLYICFEYLWELQLYLEKLPKPMRSKYTVDEGVIRDYTLNYQELYFELVRYITLEVQFAKLRFDGDSEKNFHFLMRGELEQSKEKIVRLYEQLRELSPLDFACLKLFKFASIFLFGKSSNLSKFKLEELKFLKDANSQVSSVFLLQNIYLNTGSILLSLDTRNLFQINFASSEVIQALGCTASDMRRKNIRDFFPEFLADFNEDLLSRLVKDSLSSSDSKRFFLIVRTCDNFVLGWTIVAAYSNDFSNGLNLLLFIENLNDIQPKQLSSMAEALDCNSTVSIFPKEPCFQLCIETATGVIAACSADMATALKIAQINFHSTPIHRYFRDSEAVKALGSAENVVTTEVTPEFEAELHLFERNRVKFVISGSVQLRFMEKVECKSRTFVMIELLRVYMEQKKAFFTGVGEEHREEPNHRNSENILIPTKVALMILILEVLFGFLSLFFVFLPSFYPVQNMHNRNINCDFSTTGVSWVAASSVPLRVELLDWDNSKYGQIVRQYSTALEGNYTLCLDYFHSQGVDVEQIQDFRYADISRLFLQFREFQILDERQFTKAQLNDTLNSLLFSSLVDPTLQNLFNMTIEPKNAFARVEPNIQQTLMEYILIISGLFTIVLFLLKLINIRRAKLQVHTMTTQFRLPKALENLQTIRHKLSELSQMRSEFFQISEEQRVSVQRLEAELTALAALNSRDAPKRRRSRGCGPIFFHALREMKVPILIFIAFAAIEFGVHLYFSRMIAEFVKFHLDQRVIGSLAGASMDYFACFAAIISDPVLFNTTQFNQLALQRNKLTIDLLRQMNQIFSVNSTGPSEVLEYLYLLKSSNNCLMFLQNQTDPTMCNSYFSYGFDSILTYFLSSSESIRFAVLDPSEDFRKQYIQFSAILIIIENVLIFIRGQLKEMYDDLLGFQQLFIFVIVVGILGKFFSFFIFFTTSSRRLMTGLKRLSDESQKQVAKVAVPTQDDSQLKSLNEIIVSKSS